LVLWVPDTRRPGFPDELRRQLAPLETGDEDRDRLAFIEAAAEWGE
jgi:hypothetical protein